MSAASIVFRVDLRTNEVEVRHRRRRPGTEGRTRWVSLGNQAGSVHCERGHLFRPAGGVTVAIRTDGSMSIDRLDGAGREYRRRILAAARDGWMQLSSLPPDDRYGVIRPDDDGAWEKRESAVAFDSAMADRSIEGLRSRHPLADRILKGVLGR